MHPALSELAPTGTLRAGVNLGNTLYMTRDASGELRGLSVDLMRELAARLTVPLELVVHATPGEVADAVDQGTWDVAILAIEPSRTTVAFSPPLTDIEATYAVAATSSWRDADQLDAPGLRIAAAEKTGYEGYLSRMLRQATLVRAKGIDASIDLVQAGGADAVAGLKPMLLDALATRPGLRLVEGRFMVVNHGFAIPLRRPAAAAYLADAVADLKGSGFITRSIERNGVRGISAALIR
ncbi:MAG TPA: transporter substrate-binding domain-containing protein [Ramlibacter sp.]|nr:transporter substrate-binding domain-containing protein [Ramlibacter sp.]